MKIVSNIGGNEREQVRQLLELTFKHLITVVNSKLKQNLTIYGQRPPALPYQTQLSQ